MNIESGFGSGAPYEYVVSEKRAPAVIAKKVTLVLLYVLWAASCLIVGAWIKLILPLLAFIPISIWILVFLTWRYTQVEYEYSFFSGNLTVSRILGGRSRKRLFSLTLKELEAVYPNTEDYAERIAALEVDRTLFALSHPDATEGVWAALWQDEKKKKTLAWLELNEKAIKQIRFYNATAIRK